MLPGAVEVGHGGLSEHLRAGLGRDLQAALVHDMLGFGQPAANFTGGEDKIGAKGGFAGALEAERGQGEILPGGIQSRMVRGDERAALGEVSLDFFGQFGIQGDGVGQYEHFVGGEVAAGVEHIELAPGFLQHHHRPGSGIGYLFAVPFFGVEQADIGEWGGPGTPGFFLFHLCVNGADQVIGGGADFAVGLKLVADGAFGAQGQHLEALKLQRGGVLEGVKISPGGVKLAGHAENVFAQSARIAGGERKMQVAPAAAGQGFQLQVAVSGQPGLFKWADMPGIIEDGAVGGELADESGHFQLEGVNDLQAVAEAGFGVGRVQTGSQHGVAGPDGGVIEGLGDIEEETVDGHELKNLADVLFEKVEVGRVHHEKAVEPGFVGRGAEDLAIGTECQPFGVLVGGELIPLDGGVDGHANAARMACGDHLRQ